MNFARKSSVFHRAWLNENGIPACLPLAERIILEESTT
jgi:hypothetical protein